MRVLLSRVLWGEKAFRMLENLYFIKNSSVFTLLTKRWFALSASLLIIFLLASCATVTKRDVVPFDLPAEFIEKGGEVIQPDWWIHLDDPGLTQVINKALAGNFNLLAARDRLAQSEASAKKAGADLIPSLNGKGFVDEEWVYRDNSSSSSSTFRLALAASYEVDLWGRLRFKRDASLLDVDVSVADMQTAAISLAAEVAKVWYQIAEVKKQIALAEKQQRLNRNILELITTQFKSGQAGIADVMQQKQLVETSVGDIIVLSAQQRILEHQLAILIGVPPTTQDLPSPEGLATLPPLPQVGVPLDLLLNRPDVQSDYYALLAADQRVGEAIANRFPKLSISADLSTGGDHASDLFSNWLSALAANLVGPIVDGGYRKAEVERVEAVARQRFHVYGQTVLDALGEVEAALLKEKEQQQLLDNLEIRLNLAQLTIERVGDRYRQGVVDYQRVLSALLSHQNLQQKILKGQRQKIDYRIQLYRALGGRLDLPDTIVQESNLQNELNT